MECARKSKILQLSLKQKVLIYLVRNFAQVIFFATIPAVPNPIKILTSNRANDKDMLGTEG
jgi:hypothetical protein